MPNPSSINLFGEESSQPPSQRDSATSRKAVEVVAPRARALRAQVLETLRHPATDDEGAERLGISPNTWRPRRVELVRRGDVVRVGTGSSAAGNPAAIWQARARTTNPSEEGISAAAWEAALERPSWMSQAQHRRLIQDAVTANHGDLRRALAQVAKDLEALR